MTIDNRLWAIITAFVCLLLLAAGWFLGVEPRLAAADKANDQTRAIEDENAITRLEIARLEDAEADRAALEAQLAQLRSAIPAGVDGSAFLSMLDQIVAANGVAIDGLSIADPVPYTAPEEGELSPLTDPAISSENFVVVPVQVSVLGTNDQVLGFIAQLQASPRLFLVTNVSKSKEPESDLYKLSVSGSVYVLRDPAAEAAADAADAEDADAETTTAAG